jgi:hypothetical protein
MVSKAILDLDLDIWWQVGEKKEDHADFDGPDLDVVPSVSSHYVSLARTFHVCSK